MMTAFSRTCNLQTIRDTHPRYIFLLEIMSQQHNDSFGVLFCFSFSVVKEFAVNTINTIKMKSMKSKEYLHSNRTY